MNNETTRVIYAGTPEFAVPALQALYAAGYQIMAVYTQPDRPAGRGRRATASPVKLAAQALGVPVVQPADLKNAEVQQALAEWRADLMVVAAYGQILPASVLELPRYGCINIHASLLPRWRGAAPIHRAIEAGDKRTGITIMQMDLGLDTGDVLLQQELAIDAESTSGQVHDALARIGAEALLRALTQLQAGQLRPRPQDPALASYAEKLHKSESQLDWTLPAVILDRKIRAFNPWPVAQSSINGHVLRIWRAEPVAGTVAPSTRNGQVVVADDSLIVATGAGLLRLWQVQSAGKKLMDCEDFLRGNALAVGDQFDAN